MKEKDIGVRWFNTVYYPTKKTYRAARYEDGVLPRLRQEEIVFFTPWGPRYSYEERGVEVQSEDKEVETLKCLAAVFEEMQANMPDKKWKWLFLGADLYGTRINRLPQEVVSRYFHTLQCWLHEIIPMVEFMFWSGFDAQAERYRNEAQANFENYVPQKIFLRTTQTAVKFSGGDPKVYCIERVAEALLIEELLHPIKMSAVRRDKDDGVDVNLPRLYFLSEGLHGPWL